MRQDIDIKGENGKELTVCVVNSKEVGKRDIIIIPKPLDQRAFSVRSLTELGNKLRGLKVPHNEVTKAIMFASEKLKELEG